MKKNRGKMVLYVSVACMVSVMALLGGMGCYATQEGNRTEIIGTDAGTEQESANDVINEVIAGGEAQKNEEPDLVEVKVIAGDYESVPILTWDEFYALGGDEENALIKGDGIKGTLGANDLSMEEAGRIGLKEIADIYREDMEGLMVMMALDNANYGQFSNIWNGYATNYADGDKLDAAKPRKVYNFAIDAVTGEILSMSGGNEVSTYEGNGPLSEKELGDKADTYVTEYGLGDTAELTREFEPTGSSETCYVIYSRDGKLWLTLELRINGELMNYRYASYNAFLYGE